MANLKRIGETGEALAATFLTNLGYRIVAVNVRPLPGMARGEIDIIAYEGDTLCFVEVKARRSADADATESVTPAKRRQLVALAEAYLSAKAVTDTVPCRFDVVAVTLDSRGAPPAFTLFRDAFSPEG